MIPISWMPDVVMERIILHWTAGTNSASDHDRDAYHILVEGDLDLVRGKPSIADNAAPLKSGYAAHTRNCNTRSIGLSICGMGGAVERPFSAGRWPITEGQFNKAAEAAAALCARYSIPVTRKTVLFHAEVQGTLRIAQRGKWDVTVLPFNSSVKGAVAVGDFFRAKVIACMSGEDVSPSVVEEDPVPLGAYGLVSGAPSLNFRSGPGTSFEKRGDLPEGTSLTVLSKTGDWLNVKTPAGYEGWVHGSYVKILDGPPVEVDSTPDPTRALIADIRALLDQLEEAL